MCKSFSSVTIAYIPLSSGSEELRCLYLLSAEPCLLTSLIDRDNESVYYLSLDSLLLSRENIYYLSLTGEQLRDKLE